MNLYELTKQFDAVIEKYQHCEPAELADLESELEAVEQTREQKLSNCCAYLKNIKAECIAIDTEIDRLKAKKEILVRRDENFKNYFTRCLGDGEKFSNGVHSIGWRKSTAVEVFEESAIPKKYVYEKVVTSISKILIGTDLKDGIEVPGAKIVTRTNLQVS